MTEQAYLEETLQVWQPYYEQELTLRDADEIVTNWSAFIDVLAEWTEMKIQRNNGQNGGKPR